MAGLEELRRLRKEKKTRASTLNYDNDDAEIYEELSDNEYRALQRERMREDDFVVDDNGEGYVDNGQDEWAQQGHYESEEEEKPKERLVKKRKVSKTSTPTSGDVGSLFRRAQAQTQGASAPTSSSTRSAADTSEIDNLIDSVGSNSSKRISNMKLNRSTPLLSSRLGLGRSSASSGRRSLLGSRNSVLETPIRAQDDSTDAVVTPTPGTRLAGISRPVFAPPRYSSDVNPAIENTLGTAINSTEDTGIDSSTTKPEPRNPTPPEEASHMSVDTPEIEESAATTPEVEDNLLQTPTPAQSEDDILGTGMYGSTEWRHNLVSEPSGAEASSEPPTTRSAETPKLDGDFTFYWTDYQEVGGHTLMLFGRTATHSVALAVKGLKRDVYYLPLQGCTPNDVLQEIQPKLVRAGVTEIVSRPITKKYCFGIQGVPKEADYLEMLIPYPHEPPKNQGRTFGQSFGTNTPLFETFAISRSIMGPCWLTIKNAKPIPKVSWTKIELEVSSPNSIEVAKEQPDAPPMSLMSLSLRTKFVGNKHEIVAITARFFQNIKHDTTTDSTQLKSTLITGIRPIDGVMPPGFRTLVEQHNAKAGTKVLWEHATEKSLVSWFMAKMALMDPDVIIGHGTTQVHLAILLQRALDVNERLWSRLGRRRLNNKPKSITAFTVQDVCSGRLICDLNNTMGHELTQAKCSEFTLEEMCDVYLGQKRQPYDTNVASTPWLSQGAEGILRIIQHNELDTLYTTSLVIRLQMLPLTRQLTQLAGNAWAKTLAGTRSGRNDFLLLHEFTHRGYIVPDHVERDANSGTADKGVKYQGGAVFEPEKGLYRSNVLVMDFNSLYPSLIQEYNICFSTIDLAAFETTKEDANALPEAPSTDVPQGVLPEVIHRLVDRRRQVKGLMKDKSAPKEKLAEWEIRQQALKLTANSMYGCLGLANSRFAARPLAMLVTAKGRETLHHTRALAEKENLRVLYGDTDSVMIEAGIKDYAETIKIGTKFKKLVNDQYRQMELDIDNVFSAILLYAKKKYAAMNVIDNGATSELQVKGLDLKRREYCAICKEASRKILEILFSADDESAFETEVVPYLSSLAKQMRNGDVPLGKYIIRNQLNKDPSAYTDKRMPQLTVAAARIAAGDVVKAKDVISYIISQGSGAAYERAVSVANLRARKLMPDVEYYLDHQLFAPIDRLCMYVPGYDRVRLGEALGLDKKKLNQGSGSMEHYDSAVKPLETTMTDAERFGACDPLVLHAPCGHEFAYTGISDPQLNAKGLSCPECSAKVPWAVLAASADAACRSAIRRYYIGWLKCSEEDCGLRTRQVNGYGRRCPRSRCRGRLSYLYSDRDLYTQLSYLASLFDPSRAGEDNPKLKVIVAQNMTGLETAGASVDKYLNSCGRRFVDMSRLFPTLPSLK